MGVAQGNTIDEYVECFERLKGLGYEHIAIGGLLRQIEKSSRYVQVRNEDFIEEVVGAIRKNHPNAWLFLLGTYHPNRHHRLNRMGIFGADFKGWILNYEPPDTYSNELELKMRRIEKTFGSAIVKECLRRAKVKLVQSKRGSNSSVSQTAERELLHLRCKIGKKVGNRIYLELIREQAALRKNREELRARRFTEVKKYLNKHVFGKMKKRKLLIISCSDTKRPYPWQEKAINVYDGPFFRILRNADAINNGVDLRIVSAKFGMIPPNKYIRPYDMLLTAERAQNLNKQIMSHLKETFEKANYDEIKIIMGQRYLSAVEGIDLIKPEGCRVEVVPGRIGEKLHELKDWLGKHCE